MIQGFESQHRGFHRRPSASFLAFETNCGVKYSTWPAAGTTITNEGSAGATYNGTAADNDYVTQLSGATSFVFNDANDQITCPGGAAIDNLPNMTWEFIVKFNATGNYQALWSKANVATGFYFGWGIDATGHVYTYRNAVVGTELWTTDLTLTDGSWHTIQTTWACGTAAGATPIVKIGNVACTMTHTSTGTGNWGTNASKPMYLGSRITETTYVWTGAIALFRLHDAVLTALQLTQNYNADKWRVGI